MHLWISLLCYTISIFWYELGFFLPAVLITAALLYERKKLGAALLFLLPVFLYGLGTLIGQSYPQQFTWGNFGFNLLVAVPNHYFGRQMIKSLFYGTVRFPSIEFPWILLLSAANLLVLWGLFRWLRKISLPAIPSKALILSLAMWILFLAPAAMGHRILSRHTALSSIGFSILVMALLRLLLGARPLLPVLLTLLCGAGLVVNQGIAWNQVVACRMNQAILETLQEKKGALREADRVLMDQHSFAQKIPYTCVSDPLNQLDTYWGVDGLPGKNFKGMVAWAAGREISLEVARSEVRAEGDVFSFQAYNETRYQFERTSIPREKTVLIDYAAVYPNGFHHGKRGGSSRPCF